MKYFDSILNRIENKAKKNKQEKVFKAIASDTRLMTQHTVQGSRILFGPSFCIHELSKVHDFLLSQALRLRGAQIIPCVIGDLCFGQNSVFGGLWGGFTEDLEHNLTVAKKNSAKLKKQEKSLWSTWSSLDPIEMSSYVTPEIFLKVKKIVASGELGSNRDVCYLDMPVGRWAMDVLRNNYLVGDEKLIPGWEVKFQELLNHVMIMVEATTRLIDDVNPDIIVTNDTFYYPWAIFEMVAAKKNIPCYNQWSGTLPGAWCYAKGVPAMLQDFSRTWNSFKDLTLDGKDTKTVEDFLAKRVEGKGLLINSAVPSENANELIPTDLNKFDSKKPTALLASNVIWDLAALNKSCFFEDMIDWIMATISYFSEHAEFQLIIKPHPAEENKNIIETREKVYDRVLGLWCGELPKNVFLLSPRTDKSIYELLPICQVGLVFTTTVGMEMTYKKIPVITVGQSHYRNKGFTFDPEDESEYFGTLGSLLANGGSHEFLEVWANQARKFIFLNFFKYLVDIKMFDYSHSQVTKLHIKSARDLQVGANKKLDMVCEKILNKEYVF